MLATRAFSEGVTSVVVTDDEAKTELAAVVPIGLLNELAHARMEEAAQAAADRDATAGPAISQEDLMTALGLGESDVTALAA